jgi:hypothetical protein
MRQCVTILEQQFPKAMIGYLKFYGSRWLNLINIWSLTPNMVVTTKLKQVQGN